MRSQHPTNRKNERIKPGGALINTLAPLPQKKEEGGRQNSSQCVPVRCKRICCSLGLSCFDLVLVEIGIASPIIIGYCRPARSSPVYPSGAFCYVEHGWIGYVYKNLVLLSAPKMALPSTRCPSHTQRAIQQLLYKKYCDSR